MGRQQLLAYTKKTYCKMAFETCVINLRIFNIKNMQNVIYFKIEYKNNSKRGRNILLYSAQSKIKTLFHLKYHLTLESSKKMPKNTQKMKAVYHRTTNMDLFSHHLKVSSHLVSQMDSNCIRDSMYYFNCIKSSH